MSNAFKTYIVAVVASAAGLTAVPAAVQALGQNARPDFSGVWIFTGPVATNTPATGGSAAMTPEPLTIKQTPTSIALVRTAFGQTTTMTFTIGGEKDDTNKTGAQVWTTRTRWEGKSLVTTGVITQNTTAGFDEWTYTETRSLDARGHMIIETKRVDTDGKVFNGKQDWARKP